MANLEVFEAYFKRADLDQDGRISGAEAVAFLQGSNLPKHILAQVPLFLLSIVSNSCFFRGQSDLMYILGLLMSRITV